MRSPILHPRHIILRMSLQDGEDDENIKKKGLLQNVNEAIWKPFEISWPVAIASLITGSVSLTVCLIIALFTITTSGPIVADEAGRNVS